MLEVKDLQCCGLREISGLYTYYNSRAALNQVIKTIHQAEMDNFPEKEIDSPEDWRFGAVIFTEAGRGRYGTDLAKFITLRKLGKVQKIPTFYNPNSGNDVRMFVWTVNHAAVAKWYAKER